jgi:uncharacterized protein (DUF1697 family)
VRGRNIGRVAAARHLLTLVYHGEGRRRRDYGARMPTKRYVALLRGINVGGRNPVAMADLRAAFADAGFDSVSTYIQSGNVLFRTTASAASLESNIEKMLEGRFGIPLVVVVRSHAHIRTVVHSAPDAFGAKPKTYHSDVIFLKEPLTSKKAMKVIELREGVDQVWPGPGVIYFERLSARRSQSRMSRIVGTSEYQQMTIRSWATTTKLLDLLDD